MNITAEQLLKIAPKVGASAGVYVAALNAAMSRYCIDTPKRAAHFLAQIVHESGQLTRVRENLNYSAAGLRDTWPTRFPSVAGAQLYARQPQKIANYVYANRMGNGDEKSGDGWRYRGAGWIQLTGRKNHFEVAGALGVIGDVGAFLETIPGAATSAAWFWWKTGCNKLADAGNVDAISDLINIGRRTGKVGDSHGFDRRQSLTRHCLAVLS
ncbi:glycoside hydrolase family 19 protein [Pseudoduganella chitinolytica]|uniref:Glycoside hydrolase family 19 protein n=1 Tax=Pseudoduganella chitinolytica TaxID=34070 RepID=A0ABY8BG18_9BURK|nr:glycoside hydrolase family 19 protein [Pseudoduganella chitinolytica]WEF34850.1 glycoside hydrolase family 19 protein [Pseudoduganella chitinolytica]